MKILLSLLLFLSCSVYGQDKKGYAQFGATSFLNEDFQNRFGITGSAGFAVKNVSSIGGGADFYISKSNAFGHLYGDFRFYLAGLNKQASPFFAFQPGFVLYNNSVLNVTTKGSFGVNGLAGFFFRSKKGLGGTMAVGVSHLTFKTRDKYSNSTGLKISAGLLF